MPTMQRKVYENTKMKSFRAPSEFESIYNQSVSIDIGYPKLTGVFIIETFSFYGFLV